MRKRGVEVNYPFTSKVQSMNLILGHCTTVLCELKTCILKDSIMMPDVTPNGGGLDYFQCVWCVTVASC